MSYHFTKTYHSSFEDAVSAVVEELKREGFGISEEGHYGL
jgi:uncharacterized protein (DUF302 family)